jgi:hypothetical protein
MISHDFEFVQNEFMEFIELHPNEVKVNYYNREESRGTCEYNHEENEINTLAIHNVSEEEWETLLKKV